MASRHEVKSPIPGTFYRKPAPEEPPFVEIGDTVAEGDVVALVEVMKSFHQVKADASGTVSGFPLRDGEPVTAGMTIVELD
ncbi:MAG: acetyl-CoA carboxylase [Paracoccaceae bacterium]|nr:acetyl-CoA carboxylase [Paracoccaceae bacterium]MDE2912633.1 acetyl-CoA carboxylase [Paracoccaceae bacterium]